MNPKKRKDLGWKVHEGANLLFLIHTVCMNYVIAMFLLVSYISIRNHLLYFARFVALSTAQNSEQKPTTKNFANFYNHFPLLTMFQVFFDVKTIL